MNKLPSNPNKLFKAAAAALVLLAIAVSLTAYPMPARAQASTDAALSSLTVAPKNIIGFDADRTSYQVGVASTVAIATVTPTVNHPGAGVAYTPDDADDVTPGHQVALVAGRNAVTVTVTAEDSSTQDYTVSINRGVTTPSGWNAEHDLDRLIAAENDAPRGIWTNGTTIWVVDSTDKKIYAYNTDGTRDSSEDFTLGFSLEQVPYGIWSNGTTMWVVDTQNNFLYAYQMSNKTRDSDKDIIIDRIDNPDPIGIWSNTHIWVTDASRGAIRAYNLNTKVRDSSRDFDTLVDAGNRTPTTLWSDGTTMWVADISDDKIYAYRMSDEAPDSAKDFDTLAAAGNNGPVGMTSNGTTMWVSDATQSKLYAYNLPPSDDATLSALTVSPKDIIGFDADRTAYEVGVASTLSQATVLGTPNDPTATVTYSGTDADDMTDGHQITLSAGRNEVTLTVTADLR